MNSITYHERRETMIREFKDELIIYLIENGIPYHEETEIKDYYAIYIFDKDAYEKKHKHPRKYKDLYVSYLRVSHFDEARPYTRQDGICSYMSKERIMDIVDKLGGIE
jgi:hypothetical protein